MSIQAVIVGFAFVSFVQDSFEAGQFSVHASGNQKAAGRQTRAICELLCRPKRENKQLFSKVRNDIIKDILTRVLVLYFKILFNCRTQNTN